MNNRTSRYDLMIRPDPYNIIMELKAVDKLKEEHLSKQEDKPEEHQGDL